MNYSSLLLQIENQLVSLNKKGLKYINIRALTDFELKRVVDSLEETISTENGIYKGNHKTKNKPFEYSEKFEENLKENNEIVVIPETSNIIDQTKISDLKQKNITQTFVQIAKPQEPAKKI